MAKLPIRGPWLALLSVVVVGGLIVVVGPEVQRRRAAQRLADAAARLDACVANAAGRDDATLRRRAITAQVSADGWPASCLPFALEMTAALATLRDGEPRCDGG